jgi:hypothetical protein
MPPLDLGQGAGLVRLRRALVAGDLVLADALWAELLKAMRPFGARGRGQLADCFEACAALKQALGKDVEAQRFRHRAASARKEPGELQRHASRQANGGSGWDNHAWLRLQADEVGGPNPEAMASARAALEKQEAQGRRRKRALWVGAGAFAGLWIWVITGLPAWFMVPLGALVGWRWSGKS